MNIRVTWPGAIFVILLTLQGILVIPFVILGHWDDVREYASPLAVALGGWWLREWHEDALHKKTPTKGTL